MLFPTTVALSFLGSFVYAQSGINSSTELGIAAIEAHFQSSLLVPQLLTTFNPTALMTVAFNGTSAITPGESLTKTREQTIPSPFFPF